MISKKMEKAFNDQINAELFSSYLYLSMSAHLSSANLPGFANWMAVQTKEENAHAMMLFNFVLERGGNVKLQPIAQPDTNWKNVIKVFEEVYAHEQKVTKLIHELLDLALKEKDHASANFLQWFVSEQVEEEASASEILEQLKIVEGKGHGLLLLDRELQTRIFNDPLIKAGQ
jgi:ferritin